MSEELADLYVTLRTNHAGYLSGISSVTEASTGAESAVAGMSTALVTLGAAFAAVGIAASAYSVNAAITFDAALAKTQALAGASADEIASLHDQVLTLSGQVAQSPLDLANALYFVESSGIHGAAAMDVLREASMAASSGLGDLTTVTDGVTSIMNAYANTGMTAKAATDYLVAAVTQGKVPAEDLAGALGRVIGQSSALGVSLPEVVSNIAALTRQGQSASQAATSLQSIESALVKMLDPSQKVATSLQNLGLSGQQLNDDLKNKGLRATLQEIVDATNGNNDALVSLFPNIRALRDILGTTATQGDQYASILANVQAATDGAGRTAEAFGITQQTVAFQLNQARVWVEALAVRFGEWLIPKLQEVVKWGQSVNDWLQEHQQVMKELATGGLLLLTAAFAALGVAVLSATWEFVVVGAGLVAIGTGAMWAYDHVKWFHDAVDAVSSFMQDEWPKAQRVAVSLFSWLKTNVPPAWDAVYNATSKVVSWLSTNVPPAWEKVRSAAEKAVSWIKDTAVPWLVNAYDIVKGKLGELATYFSTRWDDIKTVVRNAAFVIVVTVAAIAAPIIFIWDHIHGFLMDTVTAAWKFIRDTVKGALEVVSGIFDFFLGILSGDWSRAWKGLQEIVGGVWAQIVAAVHLGMDIVGNVLSGALSRLSGIWSDAWSAMGAVLQAVYDNTIGPLIDNIRTGIDAISSVLSAGGVGDTGWFTPPPANNASGTPTTGTVHPHAIGGFLQPGENLVHQDEIVDRDTGRVTPAGQARKRLGGEGITQHNTFHVYAAPQPLVTAKRVARELSMR